MWDFWSLSPESLHQVTTLFSDRGLPTGFEPGLSFDDSRLRSGLTGRSQHCRPIHRCARAPTPSPSMIMALSWPGICQQSVTSAQQRLNVAHCGRAESVKRNGAGSTGR